MQGLCHSVKMSAGAHPHLNFLKSLFFIYFIVINMQCLQIYFILYSQQKKHRVCAKRHQNNLKTSKIILRLHRAPGSKIPGSPTVIN